MTPSASLSPLPANTGIVFIDYRARNRSPVDIYGFYRIAIGHLIQIMADVVKEIHFHFLPC